MGKFSDLAQAVKQSHSANGKLPDAEHTAQQIPISSIFIGELQYRKYVDPDKLEKLAVSIRDHGLIQPITVRPSGDRFELAIGQKRFLAHQKLGLTSIAAQIRPLSDAEMIALALIENNERSDPNPVEETIGVLSLLSIELNLSQQEVISLMQRIANAKRRDQELTDDGVRQTIEDILKDVCGITPEAFRSHRLPLLNLPEDILDALQQGALEYSKARLLGTVKDDPIRQQLLERVLQEHLSVRELKDAIAAAALQSNESAKPLLSSKRFTAISQRFKALQQGSKTHKQAEKLIQRLEELLNSADDHA